MKMLIDLDVDGYLTDEERNNACREMVRDYLDSSATSVKILWDETEGTENLLEKL